MHEVSIVNSLLELVLENCLENNIAKVDKVFLQVGEFTCLEESSLQFAFHALKSETPCSTALLIVERMGAQAYCKDCDLEFQVSFMRKICPSCGNGTSTIVTGYEVILSRIEGE